MSKYCKDNKRYGFCGGGANPTLYWVAVVQSRATRGVSQYHVGMGCIDGRLFMVGTYTYKCLENGKLYELIAGYQTKNGLSMKLIERSEWLEYNDNLPDNAIRYNRFSTNGLKR